MSEYEELFRAGVWHDLVFESDEVNKFWSIKILKNTHIRRWGAMGTDGKELITEFDTPEEARKNAETLYLSKTRAGYVVKKPVLSMSTGLAHFIDPSDLEEFIKRVYGVDYNFHNSEEPPLSGSLIFSIGEPMTKYDTKALSEWLDNPSIQYITSVLLSDCFRQGLIPAGEYIVG